MSDVTAALRPDVLRCGCPWGSRTVCFAHETSGSFSRGSQSVRLYPSLDCDFCYPVLQLDLHLVEIRSRDDLPQVTAN
jgi:hypothetical protein